MSEFVKELNFDCDTFSGMKRDMNFVLQRLIGNMQEKGCQNGTLTLKLDVSLIREFVPNYNPEIPGESREIAKPKFDHQVTSQMKVEDKKKGKTKIDKQFEYNSYIRDFFADNKGKSLEEAIKCWKYKKQLQGHNCYERTDLVAIE